MHPRLSILALPLLELQADPAFEAHPILQAAPPRRHGLGVLSSLALTPLVVYGCILGLEQGPPSPRASLKSTKSTVRLQLTEAFPAPRLIPMPGASPDPRQPGGIGHREGTSTLDPRLSLVRTSALPLPSDAIDPDSLSTSPRAEPVFLSLNPALPLGEGGNGLSAGTGRDSQRGQGTGARPTPVPDLQLVAIHQVPLFHRLRPGESADLSQPTRVRILIGADGVPLQADVLSGPDYLRAQARQAALGWRFEPLGPHGLKAPLPLTITFHPILQRRG